MMEKEGAGWGGKSLVSNCSNNHTSFKLVTTCLHQFHFTSERELPLSKKVLIPTSTYNKLHVYLFK